MQAAQYQTVPEKNGTHGNTEQNHNTKIPLPPVTRTASSENPSSTNAQPSPATATENAADDIEASRAPSCSSRNFNPCAQITPLTLGRFCATPFPANLQAWGVKLTRKRRMQCSRPVGYLLNRGPLQGQARTPKNPACMALHSNVKGLFHTLFKSDCPCIMQPKCMSTVYRIVQ